MQNIMVLYGGKSVEHDISVITALQVMQNLDKNKYNVIPVYQTINCEFEIVHDYMNPKTYIDEIKKKKPVNFCFGEGEIVVGKVFKKHTKIDCAINCCHGNSGEDGTLNALLNLAHIPITSPKIMASSVCMDKVIMKDIFRANSIPCVEYALIKEEDYLNKQIENRIKDMQFPLIVKPANLGSSIGINKAENIKQLYEAVEIALYYDSRVIVEKCLEDFKEINLSCLGEKEVEFSRLEQPMSWKDFLNFDNKYTQKDAKKILELFGDDIENLEEIYLIFLKLHGDYSCFLFIEILNKDLSFWDKFTQKIEEERFEGIGYTKIFEYIWTQENYSYFINIAIDNMILKQGYYFIEFTAEKIFPKTNESKNSILQKQQQYIQNYIKGNAYNLKKLKVMFDIIVYRFDDLKDVFLLELLKYNDDIETFKKISLEQSSYSWSGSLLPIIEERIKSLERIKSKLIGSKYIQHRNYLDSLINKKREENRQQRIREYLENIYN